MSATTAAIQVGRGMTTREFFDGVRAGRLVVQRCGACGALAVPPKVFCPACESVRWDQAMLSSEGEIASYTVIRVPPGQLAAEAPYVVVIVRMAEGVSLLGRLTGVALEALHVGMPVRFAGALGDAEPAVIAFRPR